MSNVMLLKVVATLTIIFYSLHGRSSCTAAPIQSCFSGEYAQPQYYDSIIRATRPLNASKMALLNILKPNCVDDIISELSIFEKYSVPDNQKWSRCLNCGLSNGKLILFSSDDSGLSEIPNKGDAIGVSQSQWKEFFHAFHNDEYLAEKADLHVESKVLYAVNRPVYVLPMITFHVGHIYIDLVEQIYNSMLDTYGEIRRDALLIIDVANVEERAVLQEKLLRNTEAVDIIRTADGEAVEVDEGRRKNMAFGSLFKLFSDLPLFSIDLLNTLDEIGGVVFTDLHIGIDLTHAHFNRGWALHPCIMTVKPPVGIGYNNISSSSSINANYDLARRYSGFSRFLSERLLSGSSSIAQNSSKEILYHGNIAEAAGTGTGSVRKRNTEEYPQVLFIQRAKDRRILNIDALTGFVSALELRWLVVDLATVEFSRQLQLFTHAEILISVAGTAAHNSLFMRPGTAILLFMQPLWCDWSWMYGNQAVLLGVKPFIYCAADPVLSHITKSYSSGGGNTTTTTTTTAAAAAVPGQVNVEVDNNRYFQASRKFWLQGPRFHKSDDIIVDVSIFANLLSSAVKHIRATAELRVSLATAAAASSSSSSSSSSPVSSPAAHFNLLMDELYALSAADNGDRPICTGRSDIKSSGESGSSSSSKGGDNSAPGMFKALREARTRALSVSEDNTFVNTVGSTLKPPVSLFISHIRVEELPSIGWRLGVQGELGSDPDSMPHIFGSMPDLRICMSVLSPSFTGYHTTKYASKLSSSDSTTSTTTEHPPPPYPEYSPAWCHTLDSLNYYSELLLTVTSPRHVLHLWLQTNAHGGKLFGSDTFVPIDCTIMPSAGFHLNTLTSVSLLPSVNRLEFIPMTAFVREGCFDPTNELTSHQLENMGVSQLAEFSINDACKATDMQCYASVFLISPETGVETVKVVPLQCTTYREHTYTARLTNRHSMQEYAQRMCITASLNNVNCGRFAAHLQNHVAKRHDAVHAAAGSSTILLQRQKQQEQQQQQEQEQQQQQEQQQLQHKALPAVQYVPTPSNPFVFMHVEKTGGTSIREFIVESSERLRLDYFIPCHGGTPCATLALPTHRDNDDNDMITGSGNIDSNSNSDSDSDNDRNTSTILESVTYRDMSNVSVVAGHFFWDVWKQLPTAAAAATATATTADERGSKHPSCLIMGRHPVNRAISYYYQRCYQLEGCLGYGRRINELSAEELRFITINTRQALPVRRRRRSGTGSTAGTDRTTTTAQAAAHDDAKEEEDALRTGTGVCVNSNCTASETMNRDSTSTSTSSDKSSDQRNSVSLGRSTFFEEGIYVIDEGMSEATCKLLLNAKASSGTFIPYRYSESFSPYIKEEEYLTAVPPLAVSLSESDISKAKQHLKQCVVGILEHWRDTLDVLEAWFPWMDFSRDPNRRKMFLYSNKEDVHTIRSDLRNVIIELNPCDMAIYEEMRSLFEMQLSVAHNISFLI